jgi:hypothetical protein
LAESAETPKELYSRCEANARVADRNTYERALSFLAGVSTPATYKTVLYPLDLVRTWVLKPRWLQPKDDSSPSEVKLDDQFVASLQEAKAKLEDAFCRLANEKKRDDYHAARVFLRKTTWTSSSDTTGHCRSSLNLSRGDGRPRRHSERLGFKRPLGCCRGVRPALSSSTPTKG